MGNTSEVLEVSTSRSLQQENIESENKGIGDSLEKKSRKNVLKKKNYVYKNKKASMMQSRIMLCINDFLKGNNYWFPKGTNQ